MRKAVNDVMEICSHARAQAILQRSDDHVVFIPGRRTAGSWLRPGERTVSAAHRKPDPGTDQVVLGRSALTPANCRQRGYSTCSTSNLMEYRTRRGTGAFFPNGTSDEMTLILHPAASTRKITLEGDHRPGIGREVIQMKPRYSASPVRRPTGLYA